MTTPVAFTWTADGVMKPVNGFWARRADKTFSVGENYPLVPHEERSMSQHRRYFAALNEGFSNLPEQFADRFATVEHLRKYLLIRAGYYDERSVVCESDAEAAKIAAFIKPLDDFALVVARGPVVKVFTAKSQSTKAMGKSAFQDSQEKVLALLDDMLGVERGATAANSGVAA